MWLDPVFIFGLDMGIRGAALATVLSQALSMIWILCFLFGKKPEVRIRRQRIRLEWRILTPCLALGAVSLCHADYGMRAFHLL